MKHHLLLDIVGTLLDPILHWSEVLITSGQPLKFNCPSGPRVLPNLSKVVSEKDVFDLVSDLYRARFGGAQEADSHLLAMRDRLPIGMAMVDDPITLAARAGLLHTAQEVELVTSDGPINVRLRFAVVAHGKTDKPSYRIACRSQRISPPSLESLGMSRWINTLTGGNGIILITGPTRHAKSTTAASIIDYVRQHNATGGHLATIEDPIEYVFAETDNFVVTQREVGVHYVDYAQAARETMRIAPTIVFLHEVLNASAAQAALQLGTTGHLTIATMQADTVEGAVSKFMTFLEDDTQRAAFLQNLRGVVRTCLMPNAAKDSLPAGSQFVFASEVLAVTTLDSIDKRRDILLTGSPRAKLKALPGAFEPLNQALVRLVTDGAIDMETARRHSNDPSDEGLQWSSARAGGPLTNRSIR